MFLDALDAQVARIAELEARATRAEAELAEVKRNLSNCIAIWKEIEDERDEARRSWSG